MEILVAIEKVGGKTKSAIPDLIKILRDNNQDEQVRFQAGDGLKKIGVSSVHELIKVIDDDKVDNLGRIIACNTIGEFKDANDAIPTLIAAIREKQNDVGIRASAASAIGEIGIGSEDAVTALIEALDDHEVRIRGAAAFALGELKGSAKKALPKLLAILRNSEEDVGVRINAAGAIVVIGIPSREVLTQLTEIKNTDPNDYVRSTVAESLKSLESASKPLEAAAKFPEAAAQSLEDSSWWTRFLVFLEDHRVSSLLIAAYLLLALVVATLFWLAPLWLLWVNELLMPITDFTLPWFGGFKVPVRYLFLLGIFHYRPRVLDAWINKHVGNARETFAQMLIQKKQDVYVPISVDFNNGELPAKPTGNELQPIFKSDISHLLISGDGGIGKTNYAVR